MMAEVVKLKQIQPPIHMNNEQGVELGKLNEIKLFTSSMFWFITVKDVQASLRNNPQSQTHILQFYSIGQVHVIYVYILCLLFQRTINSRLDQKGKYGKQRCSSSCRVRAAHKYQPVTGGADGGTI
jgi:hypothetical protein